MSTADFQPPAPSEYLAQLTLMRERKRRNFCLPNFTPMGWWECDVFELTASGYFREYEIKLSVADFRADARKSDTFSWDAGKLLPEPKTVYKHHYLSEGYAEGPVQFWFVTLAGLLDGETLPPWAGWIELTVREGHHAPAYHFSEHERVKAPRLHSEKANPKIRQQALASCYYRYHDVIDRRRHEIDEPDPVEVAESEPLPELTFQP